MHTTYTVCAWAICMLKWCNQINLELNKGLYNNCGTLLLNLAKFIYSGTLPYGHPINTATLLLQQDFCDPLVTGLMGFHCIMKKLEPKSVLH